MTSYIFSSLMGIGNVYSSKGDYDLALKYYEQSLEIQKALFGDRHPDVATSLNNIGFVYSKKGDYDLALKYYEQWLEIRKALFGDRHPDVASSLNKIGNVYSDKGDYDLALKYYEQSLEIRKALFGDRHPDVASSLNNISDAKRGLANQKRRIADEENANSLDADPDPSSVVISTIVNNSKEDNVESPRDVTSITLAPVQESAKIETTKTTTVNQGAVKNDTKSASQLSSSKTKKVDVKKSGKPSKCLIM